MLGRAAYQSPAILADVDSALYGEGRGDGSLFRCRTDDPLYRCPMLQKAGRVNQITRHMLGLFQNRPGARRWRQILTVDSVKPEATSALIKEALDAVR